MSRSTLPFLAALALAVVALATVAGAAPGPGGWDPSERPARD